MKRFLLFLATSALVLSFVGCSEDSTPEVPTPPETPTVTSTQLLLKGEIAALKQGSRVNANGFEADDKVGVFVSDTDGLALLGNMLDNTAFTYSSGNIIAPIGQEVYWNFADDRLNVYAYYPYTENIVNNVSYPFAVAADQSTAKGFYDSNFITAQATNLAPQSTPVNLTFNHTLSKINVKLVAGKGITTEKLAAAEKSVSIIGAVTDGNINLATGVATAGDSKTSITAFANDATNFSAIVYPCGGEISIRLNMDDEIYSYTTAVEYNAAYQYGYTLTVDVRDPQQLSLVSTTIAKWNDGGTQTGTMSDIINIPDAVFKEYLLNEYIYDIVDGSLVVTAHKIDRNNDGEISIAEAEKVKVVSIPSYKTEKVTSLSGIEYFVNLEYLGCSEHQLNTLDVSNNPKLKYLHCSDNQLIALDLSSNIILNTLSCNDNPLATLDLSKNIALTHLNCSSNPLVVLDLSKNLELRRLDCSSIPCSILDLSKNTRLQALTCKYNQFTSLDLSSNKVLKELDCTGAKFATTLDVSNNVKLERLNCDSCQLTTLDLSKNISLNYLYCSYNSISSLDLSKNEMLIYMRCKYNQLTSLDVSGSGALVDLDCRNNRLSTLNLSKNGVMRLYCQSNHLSSLDLSGCWALKNLNCGDNQITILDVSTNSKLKTLICNPMDDENGNNLLTTIYMANGQTIRILTKPDATVIEYK